MPLGWECRSKLIKQVPPKPTQRTAPIARETVTPGPDHYDTPEICGGRGYSKIRRAPAYTFGRVLKSTFTKAVLPNAPMINVRGINERGGYKVPGGLITPQIEPPGNKLNVPGPGAYKPKTALRVKRVPAYTMRPAVKPLYQPFDSWTPPPNMYCPPIPKPKAPAFTFGYLNQGLTGSRKPGPGEHNPNFGYVEKKKPAFSFGPQFRNTTPSVVTPAPNAYCEKKFMVVKRTIPAPSFGIRHSPFLGKTTPYLKPTDLELRISRV